MLSKGEVMSRGWCCPGGAVHGVGAAHWGGAVHNRK